MKTSAGHPSCDCAITMIPIANGAKTMAPTMYARNRNGVSAPARLARRFQVAWKTADTRTRPRAKKLIGKRDYGDERKARAASGSSERAAPTRRSIAIPPGPSEEDPGAAHTVSAADDERYSVDTVWSVMSAPGRM